MFAHTLIALFTLIALLSQPFAPGSDPGAHRVYLPIASPAQQASGVSFPVQYLAQRTGAGWDNLGGGVGVNVGALAESAGVLYVGTDTIYDGTSFLYRWDGADWIELANPSGPIYALAARPGGGVFYSVGAAVWAFDGSTHTEIADAGLSVVTKLKSAADGSVWVAGIDQQQHGTLKRFSSGAWSTILTTDAGAGRRIMDMLIDLDQQRVIVAGRFEALTSSTQTVVAAANVASYTIGGAIVGLGAGANDTINALATLPSGAIVAGGKATTIGGLSTRIAAWDGSAWGSLSANDSAIDYEVLIVEISPSGAPYVGGYRPAGTGPDPLHTLQGGGWAALDIDLPETPSIGGIVHGIDGSLTISFSSTGAASVAAQ